ncbi:MAG: hypothetical protein ACRDYZ_11960 [Acidimicrobiales bacterium]
MTYTKQGWLRSEVTDSATVRIDDREVLIRAYLGGLLTAAARVDDLDTWGPESVVA